MESKVFAYPNPTSGILKIDNFLGKFSIFTIYGGEIKKGEITAEAHTLDITAFPSGVYVLQLSDAFGNGKVVKIIRE